MSNDKIKSIQLMANAQTGDCVVSQVFETTNYDKFVTFPENREPDHVGQIIGSMMEYGAIEKPVICTIHADYPGKLVVVDGNNSRFARMQLGLPIPYILIENATPKEMTALNIVSRNWTARNYVDLYATMGYPDYLIFKNMLNEYSDFSCRSMQFILQLTTTNDGVNDGRPSHHSLQRGLFKCKDTKRSLDIINFLMKVKEIEGGRSKLYRADFFICAIVRLFNHKDFDPDRAIRKMTTFPFLLTKQPDATGYLKMIEDIYNYRQKSDGIVHFNGIKFNS